MRLFLPAVAGALIVVFAAFWLVPGWTIAGECSGQTVVASYYGPESGNRTANGEWFNGQSLTAASRTLPFGTMLRITYRGRSVVVRINDRGPYVSGRSIDLSRAAAQRIGLIAAGAGKVCLVRVR